MASTVSLKYRRDDAFGTVVGGICSLAIMAVIGSFVISEIYSLMF